MFEPHLDIPSIEDKKIWRYIDLPKLISLLDKQSLFFARVDKIADVFEGSYPLYNLGFVRGMVHPNPTSTVAKDREKEMKKQIKENKNLRKYNAINCWNINEYESAAMWKLYLKSNEGIAIQSTSSFLKDSIIGDERVYIGAIKYLDYRKERFNMDTISPFMHKRKSFSYEEELRALISRPPEKTDDSSSTEEIPENGIYVKVNVQKLIQKIHIAPGSPKWFHEIIESLLKKYNFSCIKVVKSEIDRNPIF